MAQERILVVEDETSIAETLKIGLGFLGYQVPCVIDCGEEAIERAQEIDPDLILMDIRLKGEVDGIDAARQIRAQIDVPVVFLTAYGDKVTVERAEASEPFGYIIKPYSIDDLRSTISIALSRHRLNATVQQEANASSALAELASALLASASLEDIAYLVLERARQLTGSEFGFVGYIDQETGSLAVPTLSREVWDTCQVEDKTTIFEKFSGLWGWVLDHQEPLLTNTPADDPRSSGTPEGHIPIGRFMAAPALFGEDLVGIIAVANAERDYTDDDLAAVGRLSDLYGVAVQRQRALETERRLSEELSQEVEKRDQVRHELQLAHDRLDYLLRRFVPAGVAQQLISEHHLPSLGGQKRTVTVLFADVRGYTSLAEVLEPEKLMALLNSHFALLGSAVKAYGGTISRYAGDLMVAVFNAPEEQSEHAMRAVRAGMAIRAALIEASERPTDGSEWPITMQFGIGINTGQAVVGYLGFEDRFDYTVIGDAINVASRLSTVAHSGEVLLGPGTFEAVRGRLRTRSLGPMQLKGKSEMLTIYEAVGEMPGG